MEEQDRTRLEHLFEENCTDGVVTREGFKTILQCMDNDPTESSIEEVFASYDADGTTGLSKEEFDEWFSKCWVPASQAKEAIAEAFKVLFANSDREDGRYPIEELIELLKTKGEEQLTDEEAEMLQKELETIDTNKDGTIDGEEFSRFLHEQGIEEVAPQQDEEQGEQEAQPEEEQPKEEEQTEQEETKEEQPQEEQTEQEQTENTEQEQTENTEQEQTENTEQEQTENTEQEQTETIEQEQTETTEQEQSENADTQETDANQEQSENQQTESGQTQEA